MPVPFGFSVGDCISVCILIKDAIRALDSTRGSSAEYQQAIRELWALDRALLEVGSLAQSFETTIELNALSQTARRTAEQCKSCIEGFLESIKGYERGLRDNGSGGKIRDVSQWIRQSKEAWGEVFVVLRSSSKEGREVRTS